MSKTVVGIFSNYKQAREVAHKLEAQGYSHSDISVVANDHQGEYSMQAIGDNTLAASGAGTGAAIGGAAGLALGLVALAIPGIGPIIALGPLAAALTGAGIGAAAGGLIGAMTALGVPEEDAEHYATRVKEGEALLMVTTPENRSQIAVSLLESYGADNVDERYDDPDKLSGSQSNDMAQSALIDTGSASPAASRTRYPNRAGVRVYPQSVEREPLAEYLPAYQEHYRQNYSAAGDPYEMYAPAYQYGSELARDPRFHGREWNEVETTAKSHWEERGKKENWENLKDSIRHGWDKVRGAA